MTDTLLRAVRRYAEAHCDASWLAKAPIPRLIAVRQTTNSELQHAIYRPLVCLVVQGTNQTSLGDRSFTHNAFGARPAAAAEQLLTHHVRTICARYRDAIFSYDVVNEAVEPATGALRDTSITRALGGGEALLDLMFHTARGAAPKAELVYNDYMSWERGTEDETHIKGVLKLLEGFRKRGTPVDTLGVQSHIRLLKDVSVGAIVRESEGPWRAFIEAVLAMGYRVAITEFDVNDRRTPADIATRDRRVADYARAYLDLVLSYPQVGELICWGMSDRYSWLPGFDPRDDGLPQRGLPYDRNFRPKPLRAAIEASLRTAPKRPPLTGHNPA